MAITLDGVVSGPTGYLNGAQVDAWLALRFNGVIPAAGDTPPAGLPDAGPVLSGTDFGGPGQWQLTVPTVAAYYVRVTYPVGATNAKSYWAYDNSLVLTQGNQGAQGVQGTQGYQGLTGPQGSQGTQGVQGSTGSQGPQGFQGPQGLTGTQGSQGVQGSQGSQGYQGFQGNQGFQGTQGSPSTVQGPQGYQGFQGYQGYQGNQGTMGNTGAQGPQGFQGLTGPQGTQGFQGDMGNQGAQGFQGFQGATGPQGSQGTQGFQGFQGTQGVQGTQGNQGFQGTTGTPGTQGPQGYQGNQGTQGTPGIGVQGPQGAQGAQGPQGATGSQGPQGFGVPTGGTTGQALIKNSGVNYDTGWQSQLPLSGGTMSGAINMNSAARITNLVGPQAATDPARAGDFGETVPPTFHANAIASLKAWTWDPAATNGQSNSVVTNSVYYTAIYVPYAVTITGVQSYMTANTATVTAAGLALYNATTQLAAVSGVNALVFFQTATNNAMSANFISPVTLQPGVYWIGFYATIATGSLSLYRANATNAAFVNINTATTVNSLSSLRSCTLGSASLPATISGTPTAFATPWFFSLY